MTGIPLRCAALFALGVTSIAGSGLAGVTVWSWAMLPASVTPPPVPADNAMTPAKIALGRQLFYEPALSLDGSLPCSGCHQQARGFTDGQPRHVGVSGQMGERNVIGLANVAWRRSLTWLDPSVTTLERQALIPMAGEAPVEMGMHGREAVLAERLAGSGCYRAMFARAFPEQKGRIDMGTVAAALSAFQRSMVSFDSPYDRYLRGDRAALSPVARQGAGLFKSAGCANCHAGRDLTDDQLHYTGTGGVSEITGGYGARVTEATEQVASRFRTPSLRNVAVTGPWLHDGASTRLDDAIRRHAAQALVGVDIAPLLAFLEAQTDERFLRNPALAKPAGGCAVPTTAYRADGNT